MKKYYKKIILFFVIVSLLLSLSFFVYKNKYSNNDREISGSQLIQKDNKNAENGGKILVATSVVPQSEFVEKIGKEKIVTITMIPPGSNHNYDPSPKQLECLSKAKIYIMLNSGEPFEDKYMETFRQINSKMKIINSSENIPLIIINNKKDPHIWLSPKMAIIMVENIFNGLACIDPINYEYYKSNKDIYVLELDNLDKKIESILSSKKNKIFIVYHPAWSYFARDYNLVQVPIELEGKEPTPKNMNKLISEAKENNIKVVFVQEQMSSKVAKTIASEINGTVISLNPLSKNYIENMEYMINVIADNMN